MLKFYSKKLILGSKSPRRQELLKGLCIDFEIRTKEVDESYPGHLTEEKVPLYIAEKKAAAFKAEITEDELVITSDTVVCLDGKILEKPANLADAKRMVGELSGNQHTVYSAVCLMSKHKQVSFYDKTDVQFKTLTSDEIDFYVDNFKPLDKAGAYGVQEWIGYIGIENMNGSYFTVMGMPMHLVYSELKRF